MPVAFYAAWLPRSFTLNALGDVTAASPPDVRVFDYFVIVFREADLPPGD